MVLEVVVENLLGLLGVANIGCFVRRAAVGMRGGSRAPAYLRGWHWSSVSCPQTLALSVGIRMVGYRNICIQEVLYIIY